MDYTFPNEPTSTRIEEEAPGQVLHFCNLGEARVSGRALSWEIGAELCICHVRTQRLGQQKINDHQDH